MRRDVLAHDVRRSGLRSHRRRAHDRPRDHDQRNSRKFGERSGLQLPGEVRRLCGYMEKLCTEAAAVKSNQDPVKYFDESY